MAKPMIPFSVSGVLKTRSRPKRLGETHGGTENASESYVFAEDAGGGVGGEDVRFGVADGLVARQKWDGKDANEWFIESVCSTLAVNGREPQRVEIPRDIQCLMIEMSYYDERIYTNLSGDVGRRKGELKAMQGIEARKHIYCLASRSLFLASNVNASCWPLAWASTPANC